MPIQVRTPLTMPRAALAALLVMAAALAACDINLEVSIEQPSGTAAAAATASVTPPDTGPAVTATGRLETLSPNEDYTPTTMPSVAPTQAAAASATTAPTAPAAAASPTLAVPAATLSSPAVPTATHTEPPPTPTATAGQLTQPPTPDCADDWFFAGAPIYTCPGGPAVVSPAAFQPFERGRLLWIEALDTFYVLYDPVGEVKAGALRVAGPLVVAAGGSLDNRAGEVPLGFYEPVSGFGLLWRGEAQGVPAQRPALGWATRPEAGFTTTAQCDEFYNTAASAWSCYFALPGGAVINYQYLRGIGTFWSQW